jgi:type VI protein secretion system component VasA
MARYTNRPDTKSGRAYVSFSDVGTAKNLKMSVAAQNHWAVLAFSRIPEHLNTQRQNAAQHYCALTNVLLMLRLCLGGVRLAHEEIALAKASFE